jgi:hypothetical protein
MCERFSTGWDTSLWKPRCGISCPRAMFTTGLIGLSCPASMETQVRQGGPFNRKSLPAADPSVSTIDSTEPGSFSCAASNPKIVLGAICLARIRQCICLRRPCEQELSFFCPVLLPIGLSEARYQRRGGVNDNSGSSQPLVLSNILLVSSRFRGNHTIDTFVVAMDAVMICVDRSHSTSRTRRDARLKMTRDV